MLETFLKESIRDITIETVQKTELNHDLCDSLQNILVIFTVELSGHYCSFLSHHFFRKFQKVLEICDRTMKFQDSSLKRYQISKDKLVKEKYRIIYCDHHRIINLAAEGGFTIKELPLIQTLFIKEVHEKTFIVIKYIFI